MKKYISLLLIIMIIMNSKAAYGSTTSDINSMSSEEIQIQKMEEKFHTMSEDELNDYISHVVGKKSKTALKTPKKAVKISPTIEIKYAWLAAAELAKMKGYTCSAELVKCSVYGNNYYENSKNGLFSKKISNNRDFKAFINADIKKNDKKGGIIFKKSNNKDLYYSLHKVSIISKRPPNLQIYTSTITDIFDFDKDKFSSLFTQLVNDWGLLCQNLNVLKPIDVKIIV